MGAPRVLAIASAGGHWIQLNRLRPAWDGCETTYVTTDEGLRGAAMADAAARGQPQPGFHAIPDANRDRTFSLILQLMAILRIMLRGRPDVVISTGASPGYFALRLGRLLGAKTVWVDSAANAEELSLSGRRAGPHARIWLTQWPHLAGREGKDRGPSFEGSVI
ncbi:MAG: UDP-N-acetylglucosamine--LPS N-acetylglucosamine transferase [Pseudomonadota bacterium]